MMTWEREIQETSRLRWNGIEKFQAKITFSLESGSYLLKTATLYEELIDSFRLRHEVFYQEFQGIDDTGLDIDEYDTHFDHLIIIHKESKRVVGTYRLSCSEFTKKSYTGKEFFLDEVYQRQGPYLELGRACIHKDHRKGSSVISLLWRGIVEYMNLSGANVLFGCSSIKVNNPENAALVYKCLLDQGLVLLNSLSRPTKDFEMPHFSTFFLSLRNGLSQEQEKEAEQLIPSLLKSYLKLGAKIASIPAFDRDFDCIDMLTIVKKEELANCLARRFRVVQ